MGVTSELEPQQRLCKGEGEGASCLAEARLAGDELPDEENHDELLQLNSLIGSKQSIISELEHKLHQRQRPDHQTETNNNNNNNNENAENNNNHTSTAETASNLSHKMQQQHHQENSPTSSSHSESGLAAAAGGLGEQQELELLNCQPGDIICEREKERDREPHCCAKCCLPIRDKFIFSLADLRLNFHASCLRCCDCSLQMDQKCFVSPADQRQLFCRSHFYSRFGPRCSNCRECIESGQLVQEVKQLKQVYHLTCFTCSQCKRRLQAGEQLHLLENGRRRLCEHDFNKLLSDLNPSNQSTTYHTLISTSERQHEHAQGHAASQHEQQQQQQQAQAKAAKTMRKLRDKLLAAGEHRHEQDAAELEEQDELKSLAIMISRNGQQQQQERELDDQDQDSDSGSGSGSGADLRAKRRAAERQLFGQSRQVLAQRQSQLENDQNKATCRPQLFASNQISSSLSGNQLQQQQQQTQQASPAAAQEAASMIISTSNTSPPGGGLSPKHAARNQRRRRRRRERSLKIAGDQQQQQVATHNNANNQNTSCSSSSTATLSAEPVSLLNEEPGAKLQFECSSLSSSPPTSNKFQQQQQHDQNQDRLLLINSLGPEQLKGSQQHQTNHSHLNNSNSNSNHHPSAKVASSHNQKPTRVRTVLNEKQLETLRRCYASNPRPDALTKDQLVNVTGLSARVIRVWFQNKRCKDKKKNILSKKMGEDEDGQRVCLMGGIGPMVAASPSILQEYEEADEAEEEEEDEGDEGEQEDAELASDTKQNHSPAGRTIGSTTATTTTMPGLGGEASSRAGKQVEIHAYQPPWQALAEYELQHQHQNQHPPNSTTATATTTSSSATPNNQPANFLASHQTELGRTAAAAAAATPTPHSLLHSPPPSPRFQQIIGQIHGYQEAPFQLGQQQQQQQEQLLALGHQQQLSHYPQPHQPQPVQHLHLHQQHHQQQPHYQQHQPHRQMHHHDQHLQLQAHPLQHVQLHVQHQQHEHLGPAAGGDQAPGQMQQIHQT